MTTNPRPYLEEKYSNGVDTIHYVVYRRTTGSGFDEVLQHKAQGIAETAHITLHPDGVVNFRVKRSKRMLEEAVVNDLKSYRPSPSVNLRKFLLKIREKI